ncbi:MAG TPA: hypothetical protein VFN40_07080 [Gemmatimonadales bacterium]|nr:hypothetical protein [Gemmatimonadales bacterium]
MAAKKKTSRRPSASKSKKPVGRKSTGKRAPAKPAGKQPATRSRTARGKPAGRTKTTRRRRITAAVRATAKRGLSAAKQGLDRIKSSTSHLVDEVRERLTGDEERGSSNDGR